MGLLQWAVVGATGYAIYRATQRKAHESHPAFASAETSGPNFAKVRNAGPESIRDGETAHWDTVDQAGDESFPASDPPAMNKFT